MFLSENSFLWGIDNLYVTMISTWLCINMIYLGIDNIGKIRNKYLSNVITFAISFVLTVSAILYIFIQKHSPHNGFFANVFPFLSIGLYLILFGCLFYYFRQKKKYFFIVLGMSLASFLLFVGLIYLEINLYTTSLIATALFSLLTIIIMIKICVQFKNSYALGLLYTLCASIVMIAVSYIGLDVSATLTAFIKMLLCLIMSLSFFIFYCQNYSYAVKEKEGMVEKTETKLNKAEKKIEALGFVNQDTNIKNIHRFKYDVENRAYKITHLLMLNLDNYRFMYNATGYQKSVNTILQVAEEIEKIIDKKGKLYHISNDKFIIALNCSNEECGLMVRYVLDLFTEHEFFAINLKPYVGFTNVENRAFNYENVLRELELASEAALKSSDFYAAYNYDMYKKIQRRIGMENHLRNACENQTWEIFLQPKIDVKTNKIVGAEGLVRWKGQESRISPAQFIPLAEEMGLIVDIGKTIIHKSFLYSKAIVERGYDNFVLAVNLSAYQLMRKDFVQYVVEQYKKCNANPRNITFEITETAFIDNMDRVKKAILELRNHGFKFSLDDFGTGYSSIGYLSAFELDEVKFDKDFTSNLKDAKNMLILETITHLAKELKYKIVTEGIESKEQLEMIRKIGCDVYQGYYFSKPVSLDDFIVLLEKNRRNEYLGKDEANIRPLSKFEKEFDERYEDTYSSDDDLEDNIFLDIMRKKDQ